MEKLVRDRIPEIIRADGKEPNFRIADDEVEYAKVLNDKLFEEAEELAQAVEESDIRKEIADVLEVLDAVAKLHGIPWDEVLKQKAERQEKRGAFDKKYILDMSGYSK